MIIFKSFCIKTSIIIFDFSKCINITTPKNIHLHVTLVALQHRRKRSQVFHHFKSENILKLLVVVSLASRKMIKRNASFKNNQICHVDKESRNSAFQPLSTFGFIQSFVTETQLIFVHEVV